MNEKISIKFEKDLLEQTYKFRDGSNVENFKQAVQFIDETFFHNVLEVFSKMSLSRFQRWNVLENESSEDPFDTIV